MADAPALPRLADLGLDLLRPPVWRVAVSLAAPFAFAGGYFAFASAGLWVPAVLCVVALSFATYGSTSHDLVHGSLRLPRRASETLLTVIELLTLRSGRAYKLAHLHHHARFPHADDVEGAAAHGSWFAALASGIVYVPRLWLWAVRSRAADRPRLVAEGAACVGLAAAAVASGSSVIVVYVALVHMGSWVFPFVLAYLPHTSGGQTALAQTRRFRGWVASVVAVEHLYHLEHHLYPGVPHHRWPALARRLDPYLDAAGVPVVTLGF